MNDKFRFLKYFSIPIIIFIGCMSFPIYMAWNEWKVESKVVKCALDGNKYAIEILVKYQKPWKLDMRVVDKAIEGNQYALEILGIGENK